jgi:hypothetical protein
VNPHYALVAQRAGHRCEYCQAPEAVFNFPFEVEHPVPTCRQGADNESNRALACRACNVFKADHATGPDEITKTEVRLFNPRLELWADQFHAGADTGEIRGLSPVGRATVVRLRMNNPGQMAARKLWVQLGLFP